MLLMLGIILGGGSIRRGEGRTSLAAMICPSPRAPFSLLAPGLINLPQSNAYQKILKYILTKIFGDL